jgi:hypothetical protein
MHVEAAPAAALRWPLQLPQPPAEHLHCCHAPFFLCRLSDLSWRLCENSAATPSSDWQPLSQLEGLHLSLAGLVCLHLTAA